MEKMEQKFGYNIAKDAEWKPGLRGHFVYRDLGIAEQTNRAVLAHVIKLADPEVETHRGTGYHKHELDFHMFYVLKGWVKFLYEEHGEFTFREGDCISHQPGIKHDELLCSDDIEILEIASPADFGTVMVDEDEAAA